MSQVYEINKGVMKSIEFKGLKAQYIAYLAAGLVALLLMYAIAYIAGVPTLISLCAVVILGYLLVVNVAKYSHKYGEHGLMKEAAYRKLPNALVCRSRRVFFDLKIGGKRYDGNNSYSHGGAGSADAASK